MLSHVKQHHNVQEKEKHIYTIKIIILMNEDKENNYTIKYNIMMNVNWRRQ